MMALFFSSSAGEAHGPPASIFTPLYLWFVKTFPKLTEIFGFNVAERHLGQTWFEGLCFAGVACATLILLAHLGTRNLQKIPRGLQNLLEVAVSALRGLVQGMVGADANRYVPFLGSAFLFIFTMNLFGVLPAGRSPTMALSITGALGLTAIVMVHFYTIRDAGLKNVIKHLMGPVLLISPLILLAEVISEVVRPISLSLRLYANIYGEDNIIEAFMSLGGWLPIQFPILLLALLTSFLQAYIFTMLCTYYIASKVVHEDGESHSVEHEAHAQSGH